MKLQIDIDEADLELIDTLKMLKQKETRGETIRQVLREAFEQEFSLKPESRLDTYMKQKVVYGFYPVGMLRLW